MAVQLLFEQSLHGEPEQKDAQTKRKEVEGRYYSEVSKLWEPEQGKIDGLIAGAALSGLAIVGGVFVAAVGGIAEFVTAGTSTVLVIAGKHKGKRGRVLRVMPADGRILVEGINRVKRHQKPMGDQPGAIIEKEAPIHISNVALWLGDAETGRRVKVAYRNVDGRKVRVDRSTGDVIDNA